MLKIFRFAIVGVPLIAISALRVSAQTAPVVADLMKDVAGVQAKLVQLAKAMPEAKYSWRPDSGVRSVGEVFLHVASDNYLLPAFLGVAPDPTTKIVPTDFKTLEAYEKRKLSRDAIVAELEKSFAHLKKAMAATTAAQLGNTADFFGTKSTTQRVWIGTTTHLHEHLGQSIAYARSNHVTPPWSMPQPKK